MVNDLLDFTAAGLGAAMPLSPVAMDLESLCQEVVEETRAAHPTGKVRFQAHGDLTGEWDAGRLRQVLSNLLGNAVQHGSGAGPVELSARGEGSHVRLAIRNGGRPIPPDALPTIFDPLVRGSSPESEKNRRPGSIGLGLYIAREVAIAHGGDIDVESSEKAGTVFTVRLPRSRASRDQNGRASI
jgi:signal transduction histidine kinase